MVHSHCKFLINSYPCLFKMTRTRIRFCNKTQQSSFHRPNDQSQGLIRDPFLMTIFPVIRFPVESYYGRYITVRLNGKAFTCKTAYLYRSALRTSHQLLILDNLNSLPEAKLVKMIFFSEIVSICVSGSNRCKRLNFIRIFTSTCIL